MITLFYRLLILLFMPAAVLAQAPQALNYQAVARNANGDVLADDVISVKFTVRDNGVNGNAVYVETHDSVATNPFGLFTLEIGNGTPAMGLFSNINWGGGTKFLDVETDFGSGYVSMGTSQLLSVPYALYAGSAGNDSDDQTLTIWGNNLSITNGNTVALPVPNLAINGTTLSVENGNSVSLPIPSFAAGPGITISGNTISAPPPQPDVIAPELSGYFWTLSGNSGIDTSEFLGTTDTTPLRFRVNNIPAGELDPNESTKHVSYGVHAAESLTSGIYNTAIGYEALRWCSTCSLNTSVGRGALLTNNGDGNTAVGEMSLQANSGNENTAVGMNTFSNTLASHGNTALGASAGDNYDNGNFNTLIGFHSNPNNDGFSNSSALGAGTLITASNQVRIGNDTVQSIGGQVGWTTLSDKRVKTNVSTNVPGLTFIKKLSPVTYTIDNTAKARILLPAGQHDSVNSTSGKVYTGFLAQDVQKAASEIGFDFSGVDVPKNETDLYGLRYAEFVVPLTKAVQEQQAMIEALQQQNAELMKRIELLEKK